MSNIKNTAAGLLIFAMNIIYPQIQKVNKVIDTSIKKDNFNGAVLLAKNGKQNYLPIPDWRTDIITLGFQTQQSFIFSLLPRLLLLY